MGVLRSVEAVVGVVSLSGGRGELPIAAAESIHRIDANLGRLVQITEAGRTRERQLYLYEGWAKRLPGFNRALHPDNPLANHVLSPGRRGAVDSDEQRGVPWYDHGWVLTASDEPWHREYFPERDKHRFDEIIESALKGYGMEMIILREDGTVFHLSPVKAYAFTGVADYNAYRKVVRASGIATTMLKPPAITSLKKMPAWRVKAVADRLGVTLPK